MPKLPKKPVTDSTYNCLGVACPRCKAQVGEPCVVRNGPPDREFHLPRQDRAARLSHKRQLDKVVW